MRGSMFLVLLSCAEGPAASPGSDCPKVVAESDHDVIRSVRSVEPVYVAQTGKSGVSHRLLGASLLLEPEPGMGAELLQRRIECSHPPASSPLAVSGARAIVTSASDGFRVAITSEDNDAAAEILRRASVLAHD
jgi:hypothetical protein